MFPLHVLFWHACKYVSSLEKCSLEENLEEMILKIFCCFFPPPFYGGSVFTCSGKHWFFKSALNTCGPRVSDRPLGRVTILDPVLPAKVSCFTSLEILETSPGVPQASLRPLGILELFSGTLVVHRLRGSLGPFGTPRGSALRAFSPRELSGALGTPRGSQYRRQPTWPERDLEHSDLTVKDKTLELDTVMFDVRLMSARCFPALSELVGPYLDPSIASDINGHSLTHFSACSFGYSDSCNRKRFVLRSFDCILVQAHTNLSSRNACCLLFVHTTYAGASESGRMPIQAHANSSSCDAVYWFPVVCIGDSSSYHTLIQIHANPSSRTDVCLLYPPAILDSNSCSHQDALQVIYRHATCSHLHVRTLACHDAQFGAACFAYFVCIDCFHLSVSEFTNFCCAHTHTCIRVRTQTCTRVRVHPLPFSSSFFGFARAVCLCACSCARPRFAFACAVLGAALRLSVPLCAACLAALLLVCGLPAVLSLCAQQKLVNSETLRWKQSMQTK